MISREDIQSLLEDDSFAQPVLSVYLDMSVNSDNKRTHQVFLNKEKNRHAELSSDRENHHREDLGEAFARLDRWLEGDYDEASKGVAAFIEIGGDGMKVLEVPVPLENRAAIGERPVVAPLLQVLESYHHHGVLLVDREHLRIVSLYMDTPLRELRVETEPYPTPHDVQRGGYSARSYQARKAEEVKHFFKEFAQQVEDFVARYRPADLVLLGTDENVRNFEEFLPKAIRGMVVHRAHAPVEAPTSDIMERLRPYFAETAEQATADAINLLRDRVEQNHRATSGFHRTLEQLQEGKVERLVIGRGVEKEGAQCIKCGFLLVRRDTGCPYCGGQVRNGVDLAEAMVRLAAEQEVAIEFVPADTLSDLDGVGALLRF